MRNNLKTGLFKIHLPFTNNAHRRNTRVMGVIMYMMVYKKQAAKSLLIFILVIFFKKKKSATRRSKELKNPRFTRNKFSIKYFLNSDFQAQKAFAY
jgi:hypothetical protein